MLKTDLFSQLQINKSIYSIIQVVTLRSLEARRSAKVLVLISGMRMLVMTEMLALITLTGTDVKYIFL